MRDGTVRHGLRQQAISEGRSHPDLDEIRKVSSLLKTEVLNHANEKIASVSDLIFLPDGKIQYAILGVGGIVGIGGSTPRSPGTGWRSSTCKGNGPSTST